MKIGVLALQGAFIEHRTMLDKLGVEHFEIRQLKDLQQKFHALILPGGESTSIGKLLRELHMLDTIKHYIKNGLPVMGTCAGLILMAEKIAEQSTTHFATMQITACRNAYGRQLGSFNCYSSFNDKEIPMTFIRAPYIKSINSPNVQVLSTVNGRIVAARQHNQLAVAFHPELTSSTYVHEYFLEQIVKKV